MELTLHENPISLVVAESDADWGAWVERFETGTPNVVVVAQEPGEDIAGLALRVREQLLALENEGQEVTRAVIVGASGRDPSTLAARHSAIKAIVAPMVELGRGTLILDGQGPDRFSMAALATTVASMVRGSGVKVVATANAVANVA